MLKGLFLNTPKAQCSIHESGKMIYNALCLSEKYQLSYLEIDEKNRTFRDKYDFLAFNYHPAVMNWVDTTKIGKLPGMKTTFVLEVLPDNPFVMCPEKDFDIYCAIDPTMNMSDDRVYAFPRPLERFPCVIRDEPKIPTIGTFGFATPGKGFDLVVDAVSREFEKAVVWINIPQGTHIGLRQQKNTKEIVKNCLRLAGDGIDVRISHEYMSKPELVRWCANNTLNCFLYTRNQPGLAATTDQAISSRRPLSVSANETFRHICQYIKPYPDRSLKESILVSEEEVNRMINDWDPKRFAEKFEQVLETNVTQRSSYSGARITIEKKGMIQTIQENYSRKKRDIAVVISGGETKQPAFQAQRKRVLFVSHREQQCGIHQYGLDCAYALRKSIKYDFIYEECSNIEQLKRSILKTNPDAIVYNYYPATMDWLKPEHTLGKFPSLGIMHEVTQEEADNASSDMFDYHICPDPTLVENNPLCFRIPRLVQEYTNEQPIPRIPTIGSFGFGFPDKGFEEIIAKVQNEFDRAVIRFHIPSALNSIDRGGKMQKRTIQNCQELVKGTKIKLEISQQFLTKEALLDFLAANSLNVFLYEINKERGISSVIDYALAVHVPIAINKCGMFRHIRDTTPSICIEEASLKKIMENGITPLQQYYTKWSKDYFVERYEKIIEKVTT